jgi:Tol biopolymer transport system component
MAVAAAASFYFVVEKGAPAWQPVPLTTFPGYEANPALSPAGNSVAFSWNGEKKDNFDIYVMPLPSGTPVRLTSDAADDMNPVWSPDGGSIAFLRRVGASRAELLVVPTTGGPEHNFGEIQNHFLSDSPFVRSPSLAWSPDVRWVAVAHREPGDSCEAIYLFSITGEKQKLTAPVEPNSCDAMPAFSHDGRSLAFCRLAGWSTSDIYSLRLQADLKPVGEPLRLTADNRWAVNPIWAEGGGSILYVFGEANGGSRRELRIIDASGAQASRRVMFLHDDVSQISAGRHLVYSRKVEDTNIWRANLSPAAGRPIKPELLISSTRMDEMPAYSPDGRQISFESSRSGSREIWVANADGSHPVRMTSFGGPMVGHMNWSPDGQWIVFHARPEGQADLFVIPAAGGQPRRLTRDPADDSLPGYSHDGRWIYFVSFRSGQSEIWRIRADGNDPRQVTTSGGTLPIESADGRKIYYIQPGLRTEIWESPVEGGKPVRVIGSTHMWPFGFAVTAEGLYYDAPPHSGDQRYIRFFSFATGQSSPVAVTNRPFFLGMSVSPDGKHLLFDQYDELGSDLMLVENFRVK